MLSLFIPDDHRRGGGSPLRALLLAALWMIVGFPCRAQQSASVDSSDAGAVQRGITGLTDRSSARRIDAATKLGDIAAGDPAAVVIALPALIHALADSDKVVQLTVGSVLQHTGELAVPSLIAALEDGNEQVRDLASEALGNIGAPAVSALTIALSSTKDIVRSGAAHAFVKLDAPAVVAAMPALIAALKDRETGVRWSAAFALGRGGSRVTQVIPALIDDRSARRPL